MQFLNFGFHDKNLVESRIKNYFLIFGVLMVTVQLKVSFKQIDLKSCSPTLVFFERVPELNYK